MTSKEACDLALSKVKGMKAVQCMEYNSIFTFILVPERYDETKPIKGLLLRPWSVNKQTKEVKLFDPMGDIPLDEYKNGREVFDYK